MNNQTIPLPKELAIYIFHLADWMHNSPAFVGSDMQGINEVTDYLQPFCDKEVRVKREFEFKDD